MITGLEWRLLCGGFLGPAACLVGTGFIECNKAAAVAVIVIAVALSGISMAGWAVNHLDLAPPFAGIPAVLLPGVYFRTGGMVAILGGSKPNPFCKCTIVCLRTAFYTVNSAWLGGSRIFQGAVLRPCGVAR